MIFTRLEQEILLCCTRTATNPKIAERLEFLLLMKVDWDYLIQTAIEHGVVPLLYQSLSDNFRDFIPSTTLDQLQEKFYANVGHNLTLASELLKILELLTAHNIPVITFKGPVLAISAYANLSLRQVSDLDLLVEEKNFQKAVDLLVSQGYQLTVQVPWECHLTTENSFSSIDLHRQIVPKHLSCSLSPNYAWNHLKSLSFFEKKVPTLTPEACLLILCLNGTKECWRSLSRICDVAELIRSHPDLDWQLIMTQSQKMGFKRLVILGLILAQNLLEASLPDFIEQQLHSDFIANSLALQVSQQLFGDTWKSYGAVETTLFHIKTRERWRDKIQSFFGLMLLSGWLHPTARDRDLIPLPALLSFLYYFMRPIRVFLKYQKTFRYYLR